MREQQEEWMELCRQASVEQDPEKLFRLVCRINELLEAKDERLRSDAAESQSDGKRVFQIAYDEMLLVSRAELLKSRGYEVSSAPGNDDAKRILDKREHLLHIYRRTRGAKGNQKRLGPLVEDKFPEHEDFGSESSIFRDSCESRQQRSAERPRRMAFNRRKYCLIVLDVRGSDSCRSRSCEKLFNVIAARYG